MARAGGAVKSRKSGSLVEPDLFGKPVSTFPDHAQETASMSGVFTCSKFRHVSDNFHIPAVVAFLSPELPPFMTFLIFPLVAFNFRMYCLPIADPEAKHEGQVNSRIRVEG